MGVGLSFGKNSKTSKSSQATSQQSSQTGASSSTTSPILPDWIGQSAQGLNQRLQEVGGMDPYAFIAPVSPLQRKAEEAARGLSNQSLAYDQASDWASQIGQASAPTFAASSLLENLEAYQNPYRRQVVEAATDDFDQDAARTRSEQTLALARDGAFGGSGAALTRSQTEGNLARARNSQVSRLLADMFTSSATLSGQDADRRQQAAQANAQLSAEADTRRLQAADLMGRLANSRADTDRANISTQAALGDQLRSVDQQTRQAPLSTLKTQTDLFSGLPLALFKGDQTNATTSGTSNGTSLSTGKDKSTEYKFDLSGTLPIGVP